MKNSEIIIAVALTAVLAMITCAILCSHKECMKRLDVELLEIQMSSTAKQMIEKPKKGLW